ncbi:hypothetical protein [Mycobacterium sp.]|uniref:hypothetical protein n=1 Tax=Mycobacterium sp. TaxID=1785 RepID=UPI003BADB1DB
MATQLDKIRANPPNVVLPIGIVVTKRSWDYPNAPLLSKTPSKGIWRFCADDVSTYRSRQRPGRHRSRSDRDQALQHRWNTKSAHVNEAVISLANAIDNACPTMIRKQSTEAKVGANVFIVVDRSLDGRVEDYDDAKSRMSGIRSDIIALTDQYPRARFALISFASKATLDWPLSDDVWSFKQGRVSSLV